MTGDEAIAFVRSLGAGTPEAQQALRALVTAAREAGNTDGCVCDADGPCCFHSDGLPLLAYAFAALATSTEEGR